MKQYLEFEGITIEVTRKPIKNMHLRIYPPNGEVRISAPLKLSLKKILSDLHIRRDWIHVQRDRIKARPIKAEPAMQTGESHLFLGKSCLLNVTENAKAAKMTLMDNMMQLSVKPGATEQDRYTVLQTWYRREMAALLPELIAKWEPIIGVNVAEWGIRNMKTRWGSCNIRARRIWLNLSLIKKPLPCLESVLVHELVHLLEASHNARFYQLMDKFMPDWRQFQQALKC